MNPLDGLNERQKEAVLHKNGPLLVIAGAGAGKTKVITHRIARLIETGVKPEEILAVTFTNKAADEMKNRISQLLRPACPVGRSNLDSSTIEVRPPVIGTFHSVCARILRDNSRALGLKRDFSILDKEDSLKIVKKCLKNLGINPKQFQPTKIQAIISKEKSVLTTAENYSREAGKNYFPKVIASVWQEYEKILKDQKSLDFDDLILKAAILFKNNPEILKKYQNKWRYILIDEYQDTNRSQYILTKLLAKKHGNICVVGDEDQSIYGFRGADFGNILNFEKDWSGAKTVVLEENYRSGQNILNAANAVIGRNKQRKPKNLFSSSKKSGRLSIFDAVNEKEEAEFIAASSEELVKNGLRPQDLAVLYRANFQSRVLEESFLNRGLPYQVIGTKFFERKEVKDVVAYVKASLNPEDILSLERIINEPPRGIGKAGLMNYFSSKSAPKEKLEKIKNFFDFLKKCEEKLRKEKLSKVINFIINSSGYKNYLNNGTEEGLMRIENLNELLSLSKKYDSEKPPFGVEKFLEDVALLSEQDALSNKNEKKIRLMTVHAAKGLEFENVFVSGLEDGLFPLLRLPYSNGDEEEERRLFYVALTRAKEKLFLSFAYSRNFFGGKQMNKPSRFLNEIPTELFETEIELATTNYLEI